MARVDDLDNCPSQSLRPSVEANYKSSRPLISSSIDLNADVCFFLPPSGSIRS